ncbi:MAG: LSM domain-containing protein [Thermoplasmata archaeon]
MDQIEKPLHVLQNMLNKNIFVVVRGNKEYRGTLVGYDVHLNLVFKDAEEVIESQNKGIFSVMIVRGDNVIYISPS